MTNTTMPENFQVQTTNTKLTLEQKTAIEEMVTRRMENTGETREEATNLLADCLTDLMNQIIEEKSN